MNDWKREEKEPVRIPDAICLKMTERALLVLIDGNEHWIPKSQLHDDSEVFDDREHADGTLVISHWIAKERGLTQ